MGESVLSGFADQLREVAAETGTPTYVYDAESIRTQYDKLVAGFGDIPHRIFYSVKSNSNIAILRLLRSLGAGADIVSGGEFARTQVAGIPADDVVFSGVGKTPEELRIAVEAGVCLINVESPGEVELLGRIAEELGLISNCGIRVNPDVTTDTHPYTQTGEHGMKFGVPADEVVPTAQRIAEHEFLSLRSIGMHIGSQITNPDNFRDGAEKLAGLYDQITSAGVGEIEWLGIGGGIGIRYRDEQPMEPTALAAAVHPLFERYGLPLALEPGRYLVGGAGYLLTRCLYRKRSGSKDYLIVDAAMNDLIRPSLYGASHEICVLDDEQEPVPSKPDERERRYDVVGPICESGDFLARDCTLGEVGPGDLLVVRCAGAYGFTMSSNYNSRPRAAEVLVDGANRHLIRRREAIEDLMRGENLVEPFGG